MFLKKVTMKIIGEVAGVRDIAISRNCERLSELGIRIWSDWPDIMLKFC